MILKSTEARQHKRGMTTQDPMKVMETLIKDAPYLSNGRSEIVILRLQHKNYGGYNYYETVANFIVDNKVVSEYSIANRSYPSSWGTLKGQEMLRFVNNCYDKLHDIAIEEETKDQQIINELLLEGRRNAAKLIEEKKVFF